MQLLYNLSNFFFLREKYMIIIITENKYSKTLNAQTIPFP